MSKPPLIFLDTTIQIERVTAVQARQQAIARELAGKRIITSSYVLGEYKRTLVRDAIVLYNLVQKTEELFDVETQIAQLFNKRSVSRCLLLWATLHRQGVYERKKILRSLHTYIAHGLTNRFMIGIDEVLNTTECGLAKEVPLLEQTDYQLRTHCTRRVKECLLAEHCQAQQSNLQTVADGLKDHPEAALARMATVCAQILQDPDMARGRNCTAYLGDLVIALELPTEAAFYTTNHRHFAPLCALLGKQLYFPQTT
ncbi:MAG: hypothetical protein U0350_11995 [Caldilineaceae bacterium]